MNTDVLLTKREKEIVGMLAKGAQKWQIAEVLYISENTVSNFTTKIYEKLDITSAVQLATWYMATKYLPIEMQSEVFNEHKKLFSVLPHEKVMSYRELRRKRRKDGLNCMA